MSLRGARISFRRPMMHVRAPMMYVRGLMMYKRGPRIYTRGPVLSIREPRMSGGRNLPFFRIGADPHKEREGGILGGAGVDRERWDLGG